MNPISSMRAALFFLSSSVLRLSLYPSSSACTGEAPVLHSRPIPLPFSLPPSLGVLCPIYLSLLSPATREGQDLAASHTRAARRDALSSRSAATTHFLTAVSGEGEEAGAHAAAVAAVEWEDPDTKEVIKKTLEMGNETYEVLLLQVRFLDMWVPAVLALGREGYSIKCNGQHDVVITEKFQQATAINISYQHRTEFSIISAEGVRYNLNPGDNALPRDTIVLVLRAFRLMAVELRSREEEGISSSRINEPKNPGESFTIN